LYPSCATSPDGFDEPQRPASTATRLPAADLGVPGRPQQSADDFRISPHPAEAPAHRNGPRIHASIPLDEAARAVEAARAGSAARAEDARPIGAARADDAAREFCGRTGRPLVMRDRSAAALTTVFDGGEVLSHWKPRSVLVAGRQGSGAGS
jgi:hypothetical protein